MILLKKFLLFFFFFIITRAYTQNAQLSVFSEVSIITSGAGNDLYEKFGHTAIRIKDPALKLDLIYNYGFFDFEQPNFHINFLKGFMKYKLVRYDFNYALQNAERDERWVKEQVLNLTVKEKNDFFSFLEHNALPENASYLYDPFFNNCSTKPRDIIKTIIGEKLILSDDFTSDKSFRQLMNSKINPNTWGGLGMNIILGSVLDKKATTEQYMYLPDYLFKALSIAKIKKDAKTENLVQKTKNLLQFKEKVHKSNGFSPFLVFSILLLAVGFITFRDYRKKQRTKWLDFTLFLVIGVLGILILFFWLFSNHSKAPNNFNVLWALAPNAVVAFFLLKSTPPKWVSAYIKFSLLLLILIPILWLSKVQLFSWALIPLFILLAIRYLFLQKTLNS